MTEEHQAAGDTLPAPAGSHALVLSGVELAALGERFNQLVFIGGLWFVALATTTAAAFLPLRESAVDGRPPLSGVVAVLVVLLLVAAAIRWAGAVYRALRRWPRLELVLVLMSGLLLSVATPLRNELWWPACAILMLLAALTPAPRVFAYCLAVLAANLTAHLVSGSIRDVSTVTVLGLWIGLPFWTAMAAIIPGRLASFVMRLNAARQRPPAPPRRVTAWTDDDAPAEPAGFRVPAAGAENPRNSEPLAPAAAADLGDIVAEQLTARQLQVAALVAEGLRYREIAACLAISNGQVHRHLSNATQRLGVANINELIAVLVAHGVLSDRIDGETAPTEVWRQALPP